MPTGNYRGVSLSDELIDRVERLIQHVKTYHSIAAFVAEAVRLRLEVLENQLPSPEEEPEK